MKQVILSKSGAQKIRTNTYELYQKDIEGRNSGHYPGEWVIVVDNKKDVKFLGHIYSLFEECVFIYVHGPYSPNQKIEDFLEKKLKKALDYRARFKGYFPHSRLVYGNMDGLPGLTIDGYSNVNVVELNSCVYDQYREKIASILEELTKNKSTFHIKKEARLTAGIPVVEVESYSHNLEVKENDLDLVVLNEVFQKNGYYYDHRENRLRARRIIRSLGISPQKAIDLFCYVGSWGISFLKEGCTHVTFVDQGKLEENVEENLQRNGYAGAGNFVQEDVFKFLDASNEHYDLVCSDPPAFAKNKKNKKRAIEGYTKLHTKALKRVAKDGIFIAASCTKYVSLYEFQKTVSDAANRLNREIRILDVGVQGFDHPIADFDSNSNYIKYLMYHVE